MKVLDANTGRVRAATAAEKEQAERDRDVAEAARRKPPLPAAADPEVVLELLRGASLATDGQIRAARQIVASRRAAR